MPLMPVMFTGRSFTDSMVQMQVSFCPETTLFRNTCVNLRPCLYGVPMYASAQCLDLLDLAKNCSFPNQKLISVHPEFPDEHELFGHNGLQPAACIPEFGRFGKSIRLAGGVLSSWWGQRREAANRRRAVEGVELKV